MTDQEKELLKEDTDFYIPNEEEKNEEHTEGAVRYRRIVTSDGSVVEYMD